jgi:hypothetical protein
MRGINIYVNTTIWIYILVFMKNTFCHKLEFYLNKESTSATNLSALLKVNTNYSYVRLDTG